MIEALIAGSATRCACTAALSSPTQAWDEGRNLTADDAIALALESLG